MSQPPAVAETVRPLEAKPPARQTKRNSWLTEERLAVLRRDWPRGRPTREIRTELKALSGPPVPSNYFISTAAANHGLRRPPGYKGTRKNAQPPATEFQPIADVAPPPDPDEPAPANIPAPPAAPVQPAPPVVARGVPVTRDGAISVAALQEAGELRTETIDRLALRTWAERQKIPHAAELPDVDLLRQVNAVRASMSLDPWRLHDRGAVLDPLPHPHFGADNSSYSKPRRDSAA